MQLFQSLVSLAWCLILFLVATAGCCCGLLLLPVQVMAFAINVALGEAEDLECVEHELELALDVADQIVVSIRWVKEIVACRV